MPGRHKGEKLLWVVLRPFCGERDILFLTSAVLKLQMSETRGFHLSIPRTSLRFPLLSSNSRFISLQKAQLIKHFSQKGPYSNGCFLRERKASKLTRSIKAQTYMSTRNTNSLFQSVCHERALESPGPEAAAPEPSRRQGCASGMAVEGYGRTFELISLFQSGAENKRTQANEIHQFSIPFKPAAALQGREVRQ